MRKILLATAASMGALLGAAGTASAQPVKPVAPATIAVHLNGYLQVGLDDFGSTFNNVGGDKLNPVTTNGEFRLYPGFDAMTVDGIAYGVQVETRLAFTTANKGINNNNSATSLNSGTLYVRRAYGYLGMPDYGYIRMGQTDGAFTLQQVGVIEQFGDGMQFTGPDNGPIYVIPTKALPGQFIYADQGALYATDKVVLMSPAIDEPYLGGKFNVMASYEPNSNGFKQGYGGYYCNSAGAATCGGLTSYNGSFASTNLATERRNTFDIAAKYEVKLGNFANKISVGYLQGSPVHYTGGGYNSGSAAWFLDELQVMQVGVQTTYKGLFADGDAVTLGANVKWGQTLDGYAPKPIGARNGLTYIVGGNYVIGPYVLGASFFDGQTAGNYNPTKARTEARTLSEYGVAAGGNYLIGKDLSLYLQYMYAHSHQPGNTNLQNGNSQMQLVSLGGTFKW